MAQTDHEKTVEKQNNVRNILLAVNAHASLKQAKATEKLTKAFGDLNVEVKKQTSILREMNDTQSDILNETRRQTLLMEASNSRVLLDRSAKNAVFELKLAIERASELNTNLEKYYYVSNLIGQIESQNITFESLPEISDKEFFHGALKNLRNLSENTVSNLSDKEYSDLRSVERLNTLKLTLSTAPDLNSEYKEKLASASKLSPNDLMKEFNVVEEKQSRRVTIGKSILVVIVGLALVGVAGSNKGNNMELPLAIAGFLTFFVGLGLLAFRVITGFVSGGRKMFDGSAERQRDAVKLLRDKKILQIRSEFNKKIMSFDFVDGQDVDIESYQDFLLAQAKQVEREIGAIMKTYSSIIL